MESTDNMIERYLTHKLDSSSNHSTIELVLADLAEFCEQDGIAVRVFLAQSQMSPLGEPLQLRRTLLSIRNGVCLVVTGRSAKKSN